MFAQQCYPRHPLKRGRKQKGMEHLVPRKSPIQGSPSEISNF